MHFYPFVGVQLFGVTSLGSVPNCTIYLSGAGTNPNGSQWWMKIKGATEEYIAAAVVRLARTFEKEKNISLGTTDFKYTIDDGLDIRLQ